MASRPSKLDFWSWLQSELRQRGMARRPSELDLLPHFCWEAAQRVMASRPWKFVLSQNCGDRRQPQNMGPGRFRFRDSQGSVAQGTSQIGCRRHGADVLKKFEEYISHSDFGSDFCRGKGGLAKAASSCELNLRENPPVSGKNHVSKSVSLAEVPSITCCFATAPIYVILIDSTHIVVLLFVNLLGNHISNEYGLKVSFFQYWSRWFDLIFTYMNLNVHIVMSDSVSKTPATQHPKWPSSKISAGGRRHGISSRGRCRTTLRGDLTWCCPMSWSSCLGRQGVSSLVLDLYNENEQALKGTNMFEQSKNILIPMFFTVNLFCKFCNG